MNFLLGFRSRLRGRDVGVRGDSQRTSFDGRIRLSIQDERWAQLRERENSRMRGEKSCGETTVGREEGEAALRLNERGVNARRLRIREACPSVVQRTANRDSRSRSSRQGRVRTGSERRKVRVGASVPLSRPAIDRRGSDIRCARDKIRGERDEILTNVTISIRGICRASRAKVERLTQGKNIGARGSKLPASLLFAASFHRCTIDSPFNNS